jgi:hypothetical protein
VCIGMRTRRPMGRPWRLIAGVGRGRRMCSRSALGGVPAARTRSRHVDRRLVHLTKGILICAFGSRLMRPLGQSSLMRVGTGHLPKATYRASFSLSFSSFTCNSMLSLHQNLVRNQPDPFRRADRIQVRSRPLLSISLRRDADGSTANLGVSLGISRLRRLLDHSRQLHWSCSPPAYGL